MRDWVGYNKSMDRNIKAIADFEKETKQDIASLNIPKVSKQYRQPAVSPEPDVSLGRLITPCNKPTHETKPALTMRDFSESAPVQFCDLLTRVDIGIQRLENSIRKMESFSIASKFPDSLSLELTVLRHEVA